MPLYSGNPYFLCNAMALAISGQVDFLYHYRRVVNPLLERSLGGCIIVFLNLIITINHAFIFHHDIAISKYIFYFVNESIFQIIRKKEGTLWVAETQCHTQYYRVSTFHSYSFRKINLIFKRKT